MSARIAVLGAGKMGSAIARRLAEAGNDITLWNRTRAHAEQVGVGRVAPTAAAAVAEADVVISSLTGPDALRSTFDGPSGALAGGHGQHFIEMSTVGPDVLAEFQPRIAATGSSLVDAPILGAPPLVLRGGALVIAGGAGADVEYARPLLALIGEVRHVGPLGSGARLKLVANSMLGAVTLAAAELQVAGEAAGLDPEPIFGVLTRFVPALDMRREGYLHDRHEPPLFAVRDLLKDLDLALGLFHGADAPSPVTALVRELVGETSVQNPHLDISGVIRRYRDARRSSVVGRDDVIAATPGIDSSTA